MNLKNLNSPLPIQICNSDGTLTQQGQAFLRSLWERTGHSPGVDGTWMQMEADNATLSAGNALKISMQALREAQDALDLAKQILMQAVVIRDQARKALEQSQDSVILAITARGNAQAANIIDESMAFAVMNH